MLPENNGFKKGYTLIEVLIALSIFAFLAAITSGAMYHAFNTRARVNAQADRLNTLQLALAILERDIVQTENRPTRGNEMSLFAAFIGQPRYVEFTRGGLLNPGGVEHRSTLQRIAYFCHAQKLIRRTWAVLDTPDRDQHYEDLVLLDHVECSFAYLTQRREVLSSWQERASVSNDAVDQLPMAIQVNLNLKNWGNMNLLFIIPEVLYA